MLEGMRESSANCLSLRVDEKGCIGDGDRDSFFRMMRCEAENRMCFDCAARNANWISATYSVFLCLTCSGQHRNLGSKISFVRSVDLDLIRLEEALRIQIGGNARARTFFRNHGILDGKPIDYRSKTAERYRKLLDKEVIALLAKYRPELMPTRGAESGAAPADEKPQDAPVQTTITDLESEKSEAAGPTAAVKEPQYMSIAERSFFGSAVKAPQKPKTDEFDFDFDTAFQSGTQRTDAGDLTDARDPTAAVRFPVRMEAPHALPRRDLQNAKAISSDDFNVPAEKVSPANLARFKNAQGISSDAYFGTQATNSREGWVDDELGARLSIIREGAIQKAGELASAAQDGLKTAACWFTKMSSTPSYL